MSREDICWMSAADLAKSIRRKKLSPVEVVEDILERIEVINPKINAYVTVIANSALAEAKKAEKAVMKGEEFGASSRGAVFGQRFGFYQGCAHNLWLQVAGGFCA